MSFYRQMGASRGHNSFGDSPFYSSKRFVVTVDCVVFQAEYGASPECMQPHVDEASSKNLLEGVLKSYADLGGKELAEFFLYSRSWKEEFRGNQAACPDDIKLVGIRVRKIQDSLRLIRPGDFAVQRETYWQINHRAGYLWTSGLKDRLATYDGRETPALLRIDIQHGDADFTQVAKDIYGLTKLNYDS